MIPCSKCNTPVVVSAGISSVICPLCSMAAAENVAPGTHAVKPRAAWGSKTRNGVRVTATALTGSKSKFVRPARPTDPNKKGRGWHLKGYFEFQGKTYSFGQEITDAAEIARLKEKYVS